MPPVTRPAAPPPAAKKNVGLLAGLGGSALLAVIGIGLAVWLWMGQGAQQTTIAMHQAGATQLAATLEVPLAPDTNTPVVWTAVWSNLNATALERKTSAGELKTSAESLAKQIADLKTAATEATAGKAAAAQQAEQLTQRTAELEALKTSTQGKTAELEKQVADLKASLTKAEAAAKEAPPTSPESPSVAEGAATNAAVAAAAKPAAGATNVASGAQAPDVARPGAHVFTGPTSVLVKQAAYKTQTQTLQVWLSDKTELAYSGVPAEVYDNFLAAKDIDVYFRMKVQEKFPCKTDDRAAVMAISVR